MNSNNQQRSIDVSSYENDLKKDFLIVNIDEFCIRDSNYTIVIDYTGDIKDSLEGFYRSSYVDSAGNTQ